jgi:CheY-like chemotaxis protein
MNTFQVPAQNTVLLVEDNPDDVLLTRRAFRKAGIEAQLRVAQDGDEAVAYLQAAGMFADRDAHPRPELILLDWKLPKRSGGEVLRWIRTQAHLRSTPVVVLSSSREQEDIDDAYGAGCNSFLQKPVRFDKLTELSSRLHMYWLQTNVVSARDRS